MNDVEVVHNVGWNEKLMDDKLMSEMRRFH
jgi:hypothetical protein